MKKKIYFLILQEVDSTGESLTGNKSVTVYEILNNEPKQFFTLDLQNSDNSIKAIKNYLDDNGHEAEEFEIIQL